MESANFGEIIRNARKKLGLRNYQLAAAALIAPAVLSQIERRGLVPSGAQRERLVKVLGISSTELKNIPAMQAE